MKPIKLLWLTPILVAIAATVLMAQCQNGQCPINSFANRGGPSINVRIGVNRQPPTVIVLRPIAPVGRYSAVVRIKGEINRGHVYGSGVVICWRGRPIVITAAHVVRQCAGRVVYWATPSHRRWIPFVAVKYQTGWDVAFCEVALQDATDLPAVEIAWGPDATPAKGAMLESVGWGPDATLLVNSGVAVGYRSPRIGERPDWLDLSGRARLGDSGGPVFDTNGHLVGILWGTDDRTVTACHAGKIHQFLRETYGPDQAEAPRTRRTGKMVPVDSDTYETQMQDLPLANRGPDLNYSSGGGAIMPWRKEQEQIEAKTQAQLDAIRQQLQDLANRPPCQPPAAPAIIPTTPLPAPDTVKPGNTIEQQLDAWLHKLPIQGPLTKLEEKQLESKNGLTRVIGVLAAIDGIMVVLILGTVGVIMVGHAIYKKCHADRAAIDARLSKVSPKLAAAFDRVDDFNTQQVEPKLDPVLQKLHLDHTANAAAAKATADAALSVGTAALAAAVPPVAPVAAPIAAAALAASANPTK